MTGPSVRGIRRRRYAVCRVAAHGVRERSRDSGSAMVEFVFLGVLMLVPLVYLVMTLGRLQAGAYATTAAAREAGRAFVTATAGQDSRARAEAAARLAFADQGFPDSGTLAVACDGDPCLRPEGRVETTAVVTVPLPLMPSFARSWVPLSIPVSASHRSTVDRFQGRP